MMEGPRHQHLHQEWQEPLEEPIFKHAQYTYVAPTLPLGDTPNTRVPPQTLALSVGR